MLAFIEKIASSFISLFEIGGENFMGLVTGILPTLIILMTAVNSVVKLIGEEKVTKFAAKISKNMVLRYTLLPIIAMLFLTNPMAYSFGKFVDEKYKPAFYDAAVSFCHPILGLFPHANPGEAFVFLGIAEGIKKLGYNTAALAVRYFLVGIIVILIRGIVTEKISKIMLDRR